MAQQGRRKAAAVEKHQHLLTCCQGLADCLLHRTGNAAVQRPALDVQTHEARLLRATCALIQAQQTVASGVGVVQAFQRRRGRAEHNRNVFLAGSHQRQVAGVVAQAFLLFIGAVVFFVDDDQAGVFHRREQCRARADNNVGFAIAGGQPGIQPFAVVDGRVHQRDASIEALLEARQGLWPQVDLRDQHQRLFAGFKCFANQLQIDFGLAAARDARQ